jgi:hypothetical protein
VNLHRNGRILPRVAGALLFLAPAVLGAGCAAGVSAGTVTTADGYDAVYVDDAQVPADIQTYHPYRYDNADAYYVNGRWYRHQGAHWVTYRRPPPELERQRTMVQEAPPTRHPEVVPAYPRPEPPPPQR